MAQKKLGKTIIPHGLYPEKHELETADIFTALGKDVEFLTPIRNKKSKTPDVLIDGVAWEIKSPTGKSKTTISNALKRAVKQSGNIIIDSRRTLITSDKIEYEVRRNFPLTKSLSRVIIILKNRKTIEINRR